MECDDAKPADSCIAVLATIAIIASYNHCILIYSYLVISRTLFMCSYHEYA